jgi:hypothetical protein
MTIPYYYYGVEVVHIHLLAKELGTSSGSSSVCICHFLPAPLRSFTDAVLASCHSPMRARAYGQKAPRK